ncbi:hypothetical protein ABZ702_08185 [Streptomyces cyaneofuscatus]|uniref:hypothetical protein n=1 Tax=Streptomyces cyaneofuscatus TaxID=66883 RepID=UPI0034040836
MGDQPLPQMTTGIGWGGGGLFLLVLYVVDVVVGQVAARHDPVASYRIEVGNDPA